MRQRQDGFTAIELLITLFIAAAFLVAGYQLYFIVIKDNGQARAQSRAANVAYNYLRQYQATSAAPCNPSSPLTNSPITVSTLSNVTVSVTITCPYAASTGTNSAINISRIDVVVNYNSSQTVEYTTLTHDAPNTTGSVDNTSGLVGWWRFDSNSQASVGVDGTMNGASLVNGQNGLANGAYAFTGTSTSYMSAASTFSLGTTNITLSLWVNPTAATDSGEFIKVGEGASNGYALGMGSTSLNNTTAGTKLIGLFDGVRTIVTTQNVGTGWHHIAMVIDGSGIPSIYEDGTLIAAYSGTSAAAPTSGVTDVGGGASRYFSGSIDDVRIYNRALSGTEVTALYSNGAK